MKKIFVGIVLMSYFSFVSAQILTFEEPPTVPGMKNADVSNRLIATAEFKTMEDAKNGVIGSNFRFLPERYFAVKFGGTLPLSIPLTCTVGPSGKSTSHCIPVSFIEIALSRNKDKM